MEKSKQKVNQFRRDNKKNKLIAQVEEMEEVQPYAMPTPTSKNTKLTPLISGSNSKNSKAKRNSKKSSSQTSKNSKQLSIMGQKLNLETLESESLNQLHEKLINVILTEEEELITSHRTHVDRMCEFSRTVIFNFQKILTDHIQEFELLTKVEQPGSDIDHYVEALNKMLESKRNSILILKNKLDRFKQHLSEEQHLSTFCSEKQQSDGVGNSGKENRVH